MADEKFVIPKEYKYYQKSIFPNVSMYGGGRPDKYKIGATISGNDWTANVNTKYSKRNGLGLGDVSLLKKIAENQSIEAKYQPHTNYDKLRHTDENIFRLNYNYKF